MYSKYTDSKKSIAPSAPEKCHRGKLLPCNFRKRIPLSSQGLPCVKTCSSLRRKSGFLGHDRVCLLRAVTHVAQGVQAPSLGIAAGIGGGLCRGEPHGRHMALPPLDGSCLPHRLTEAHKAGRKCGMCLLWEEMGRHCRRQAK